MDNLQPFPGEEHQPFFWPAGQPAALLVHGFPGTPAELRALAQSLHGAGWTVQGLLLPGFGPNIETLFEKTGRDWLIAVESALRQLQTDHAPVLLLGYSMGAALAIQTAATTPPAGLILLAPFWQLGTWWQRLLGTVMKPFVSTMRPFKKTDFTDSQVRQGIGHFFPGINLDDPHIQQRIRNLEIPVTIFEELHGVGQAAFQAAPQAASPTLVIQGSEDKVVNFNRTRKLLNRLPNVTQYVELPTGHDLVKPEQPGWSVVERSVLAFAHDILEQVNVKEIITHNQQP